MKNKKSLIILTSIILFTLAGCMVNIKASSPTTYLTTEEYPVIKDSYTRSYAPDYNSGAYPSWSAGSDLVMGTEQAFLGFNNSKMPENTINVQIKIPIYTGYLMGVSSIEAYFVLVNIEWEEDIITYINTGITLENTKYITKMALFMSITSVYYLLDITTLIDNLEEITIVVMGPTYNSSLDEHPIMGFTKEYGDLSLVPSIIYTIEHEIIPPQIPLNNEILFLVIGLSIGLVIGLVAVGVIIILNKRKSKI